MSVTLKVLKPGIPRTSRGTKPEQTLGQTRIFAVYAGGDLPAETQKFDKLTHGFISKSIKNFSFNGEFGEILPLLEQGQEKVKNVLLIGCGNKAKLNAISFSRLICIMTKWLQKYGITEALCYLHDLPIEHYSTSWKIKQIAEAYYNALYQFDLFKSQKKPRAKTPHLILPITDSKQLTKYETALKQATAIADAISYAKNLENTPSNICTPTFLADHAKALAKDHKNIKVKILNEDEMRKLGMGALLGVSQGSAEEAKLICVEYNLGQKKSAPIGLVGKGITFDTGGNSLKPADSMVGMKYDMCGGAVVLATLKAAATLKLPISIVGIVAAAENMPGGTAYKPEDILTSMSGQTIEVISTDAEGRLVLADALTYCERYKPAAVIDIATLTGAVVIALGVHASALLSNNEDLAKALLQAGVESNDRAWQLPLWEEYQEQIKSPFADMANVGGRPAGAITAACFLSRFAKKFPWAHLDVAGTAAMMFGPGERYATGRPVPLLMQYLINQAKANVH